MSYKIFTIFEGTSEIQRMIIGRTVTGLDVRYLSCGYTGCEPRGGPEG
jgi:hypothetical protein